MQRPDKICAVIPVKETDHSKQRLAGILDARQRQELALAMFEDVLQAVSAALQPSNILVSTVDPAATAIVGRYGARAIAEAAAEGHTAAVMAASQRLAEQGCAMLTVPADIPLVQADDVHRLLQAWAEQGSARTFCIVPARDDRGSNAVLCAPADVVPLQFGEDSFFPHLESARECGLEPVVLRLPRIALDIDTPADLDLMMSTPARTRSHALVKGWRESLVRQSQ